jgi:hypothetical protein
MYFIYLFYTSNLISHILRGGGSDLSCHAAHAKATQAIEQHIAPGYEAAYQTGRQFVDADQK